MRSVHDSLWDPHPLFRSCSSINGPVLGAKKGYMRAVNGEFRDRGVFTIGLSSQPASSRATIRLLPSDSRARGCTAGMMHRGCVNTSWLCISGRASWTDTQVESKRAGLPSMAPREKTKTCRSSVDRRGRGEGGGGGCALRRSPYDAEFTETE